MTKTTIHEPQPLFSLYHEMEDYFFTSISEKYHQFSGDACAYFTGVETISLNLFIIKQINANFDTTLQNGIQFLNFAGLPFSIVFPSEMVSQVKNQISAIQFSETYTSIAMQLNIKNYLSMDHTLHSVYEIRCTDDYLRDWAMPIGSAFETVPEVMHQYQARHQSAIDTGKQLVHFTLYVNTAPICSLTLSIKNQLARLDDIGTKAGFQRKGYASALIRHALLFAKLQNVTHCFLEASADGVSVYRRAGFSDLFEYTTFHHLC